MAFLSTKRRTIYLELSTKPKLIRPLFSEPNSIWVRVIPSYQESLPNGKKNYIRFFRQLESDEYPYLDNNPDPLWDKLTHDDKFDRNGARIDFPARPVHLLPVWSYEDNDVKIVRQGNQFYEEMEKWADQGGDVTTCDWMCWTEGAGRFKKTYKTARQDTSQFNSSIDQAILAEKCKQMMFKAANDFKPFKDEQSLIKFLHGQNEDESTQFPYGANQSQPSVPEYNPGGQSSTPLGNIPAALPAANVNQPQQPIPQQPIPQQPIPSYNPGGQLSIPINNAPAVNVNQPQQEYIPQPSQQEEVPNAPTQTMPTFAPPTTIAQPLAPDSQAPMPVSSPTTQSVPTSQSINNPAHITLDFGKYSGKTLGWIAVNDSKYLSFLKGNKKEQFAEPIEQLLSTPQSSINNDPINNNPINNNMSDEIDDEAKRVELAQIVNSKLMSMPEFNGRGIGEKMMPFLMDVIGTTRFSDAPLDQLIKLNSAIDQKISQGN